ncbi:MAG: Rieske 2Fe-2S domain-containing protein [Gammaproteobacteria bacterium]|nr:Rieske 2Fe-2S domain-containing protein [Gammaproteobacteria bacterium]
MWHDVKKVAEFLNNTREIIDLDYTTVIIFNIDNNFYAIDHLCTHADFGLEDADCTSDGVITCPYHGAKFCVKTGDVMAAPAFENIQTYQTRVHNGMIQVFAE